MLKSVPAAVDLDSTLQRMRRPGSSSCSTRAVCTLSSLVGLRCGAVQRWGGGEDRGQEVGSGWQGR